MSALPGCTGETLADWRRWQESFAVLLAERDRRARSLGEMTTQAVFKRAGGRT